jgi:pimeloyl-ACP methyl ester carboxylesterase
VRRRDFITLLGGAAAWPVVARAQQPAKMARVGILNYAAAQDVRVSQFRDALRQLGYAEGKNLAVTYLWADGVLDRLPELAAELTNSFCRTDPDIAKEFACVTFNSDNRADLTKITIPTLILQCSEDVIAPVAVGDYMHRQIPNSKLVVLKATGHCPNLSAPEEVISAMRGFV